MHLIGQIMSQDMRFPIMWLLTCVDSESLCSLLLSLETPNDVQSVAKQSMSIIEYSSG